jgi:hypothetical protein
MGGDGITDQGVEKLKSLPQRRFLTLYRTSVTEAALADLRKALPTLYAEHLK